MQHNGYNYRTLNPWEQIALEHLSAMIGEIIGAGFENPSNLTERISDMVLDLNNWDTPDNCNEEITEILDTTNPQSNNQQPKYIPYGASGEDGDKEINPSWGDSDIDENDEDETRVPGFQDVDYESAYIYANRPDPVEDDIPY